MSIEHDPLAVPWFPEALGHEVSRHVSDGSAQAGALAAELREHWRYVFIEEVAGGAAELHSWPWPLVDQTGRLAWPDADADGVQIAVLPTDELQQRLYAPDLLRQPRAGDTFAVRHPGPMTPTGGDPMRAILDGQILDITPDARHAAKVSYFGSSAAVFHEDPSVTDLLVEAAQERGERSATPLTVTDPDSAHDRGRSNT